MAAIDKLSDCADRDEALTTLATVRDWLRLGTTAFTAAGLSFGHGTQRAVDEAAFLILETLRLPVDQLEPWLEAHLLAAERAALYDVFAARIATRKPASYLTGSAYIQGHRFKADERAIVPRSYIGELLCAGTIANLLDDRTPQSVLDLCTGGGSLAILAALSFPSARITATDLSADALALAKENVDAYGLADRIALRKGDLFAPLGKARYDLILANPPYVARAEVEAFPPEYQAEPRLAHLAGDDGLALVDRILTEGIDRLTSDGVLVLEIGTARSLIEERYPDLPLLWLDTEESEGEVLAIDARDLS